MDKGASMNSNNINYCQKQGIFSLVHTGGLFILACRAELPQRGVQLHGVAMQLLMALLMCGALEMF